jgi:tetratricopeptide (TPR) repeat protein
MASTQRLAAWACLGALALIAEPAAGQYALGTGRGLDNSLQVGTTQNFPRLRNSAGAFSNALVTGNVSGLRSFRGDVGYEGQFDFRGDLGSNDLFNFRRQSLPLELGRGGEALGRYARSGQLLRRISGGYDGAVVLRSGTGAAVGRVTNEYQPYGGGLAVVDQDQFQLSEARAYARENDLLNASAYLRTPPIGLATDQSGRTLQVTASPLTGLSLQPLGTPSLTPAGEPAELDDLPDAPPLGAPWSQFDRGRRYQELATIGQSARDLGLGLEPIEERSARRTPDRYAPLGERLGAELYLSDRATAREQTTREAARLAASLDRLTGSRRSTDEAEAEVYQSLLDRVRQRQPGGQLVPRPTDEEQADAEAGRPTAPAAEAELPLPSDDAAEEDELAPSGRAAGDPTLQDLVDRLDYEMEPMQSLAGQTDDLRDQAMRQAEREMAEGRYFDADRSYGRVLLLRPDSPLAVVGKVHAQIGAGLYLTAGRTLRSLLSAHPELIAARYDQPLLPDEDRLQRVREQLQAMLKRQPDDVQAPLLLAYLAYQRGDQAAVREHLQLLEARQPDDSIVPLLRRIWLDPETADPARRSKDAQ